MISTNTFNFKVSSVLSKNGWTSVEQWQNTIFLTFFTYNFIAPPGSHKHRNVILGQMTFENYYFHTISDFFSTSWYLLRKEVKAQTVFLMNNICCNKLQSTMMAPLKDLVVKAFLSLVSRGRISIRQQTSRMTGEGLSGKDLSVMLQAFLFSMHIGTLTVPDCTWKMPCVWHVQINSQDCLLRVHRAARSWVINSRY